MSLIYKIIRKIYTFLINIFDKILTTIILYGNNVSFRNFRTSGIPYVMVARGGRCKIGQNFAMNNGIKGNPIGCYQRCTLFVDRNAELTIGNNVGISQAALFCTKSIIIEDYVKLGGGCYLYDTDFHSLDPIIRKSKNDIQQRTEKGIHIKENAFIGAHSIILKGVTIGRNSIIGAGSVVTKSIPDNEIWAGNPAKFIRTINK